MNHGNLNATTTIMSGDSNISHLGTIVDPLGNEWAIPREENAY